MLKKDMILRHIFFVIIYTRCLIFFSKKTRKFIFNVDRVRGIFGFGAFLLLSLHEAIIDFFYVARRNLK